MALHALKLKDLLHGFAIDGDLGAGA
jgi:hypothetical protein